MTEGSGHPVKPKAIHRLTERHPMQRELWNYNKARRIVQGSFYADGRRVRRKLANFQEAGLDESGKPLRCNREAMERHNAFLLERYAAIEIELGTHSEGPPANSNRFKALFEE